MENAAKAKYPEGQDNKVLNNPPDKLFSETDKKYLGAEGLNYVYRACNVEDSKADIECGDPVSTRSVEQHVHSGVKTPSRFISATTDLGIAKDWADKEMGTKDKAARETPRQIIKIDMNKLKESPQGDNVVNLSKTEVREHFLKHPIHKNYAKSTQEVLIPDKIPASAYEVLPGDKGPDESVDELTAAMGKAKIK